VTACQTENDRAVIFANFHSHDTIDLFANGKGRDRLVAGSFLGVEGNLFNDTLPLALRGTIRARSRAW
jgi:hypothetical protein